MPPSGKSLLILGSGGFALDVADFALDIDDWVVVGLVQNVSPQQPVSHEEFPVLWIEEAWSMHPEAWSVCALGSQQRDQFIAQATALGARFTTLVHPFTRVSRRTQIGAGSIVSPGAVIAAAAHLGQHVIVNRATSIGHHTRIDDYAFLAPGVTVCGSCVIGSRAFIGAGAVISDHITVGPGAFVAAGAVVTRDVAPGDRVLGVPARSRPTPDGPRLGR